MRVRLTQIIDYWLGVPLCVLVSLLHSMSRMFGQKPQDSLPQKILLIELSEMGSAIIAYSSLVRLRGVFPNSELYFLVFKKNRESIELLNIIPKENIIEINESSFLSFSISTIKTICRLREIAIDTVIDLELFSRASALISYLSGAKNRVGFHNYTAEGLYRGSFLTHKVFYNPHQHMRENFLSLAMSLETEIKEEPILKINVHDYAFSLPKFAPNQSELTRIKELLAANGFVEGSPIVVLNPDPGEALPIRGWSLQNYATLASLIAAEFPDVFFVVIGLGRSKAFVKEISDAVPQNRFIDLTGKTDFIREVVTLLTLGKVFVTNDSGPAHFAALTDIYNIVIFGPETPKLYGPLGEKTRNIYAYYACSPCLSAHNHRYSICKNNRCLQAINVDTVLNEVRKGIN